MSNYPDGVMGNEYAIAGPDSEVEADAPCPECGNVNVMLYSFRGDYWSVCQDCGARGDIEQPEPDPDRLYDDRREERQWPTEQ